MKPSWIIWHVTNKCNIACGHCFTKSSPEAERPLSLENQLKIVKKINNSSVKLVTLIGGEPLTLPHLETLVETISTTEREINLDTNGILLRNKWKPVYNKINRVNISIDDINEETNNKLRGGHSSVLDAIDFLSFNEIPWGGNITITKLNHESIYDTAEFLLESGAKVIGFSRIKPIGRGSHLYPVLKPTNLQEEQIFEKISQFYKKYSERTRIIVSGFYSSKLFEEGAINKLPSCLCGDMKITINHDGFVYPCEAIPFLFSKKEIKENFGEPLNVLEHSFEEIMASSFITNWRDAVYVKPKQCSPCRYKLYCNSGCRALSYKRSFDLTSKDASCKILADSISTNS